MPEHNSYTVIEGGSIDLSCTLLYGFEKNQTIQWYWLQNDKVLDNSTSFRFEITNDDINHKSTLHLRHVPLSSRGQIECLARNEYGDHSREVLLRVKSKMAPLWPALGILAEVVLLILIIFFCTSVKKPKAKPQ
jgi:hypothetical protein